MKTLLITAFLVLVTIIAFGQATPNKSVYLKLSGGQVSFGSGDFLGYSFALDASRNILRKSSFALDKLLLGGELIFESGSKNPIIQNPTQEEFFSKSFQHVSSTLLWAKLSYYPFRRVIQGFNIQVGPTLGYSYRSMEARASRTVNALGESTRGSILRFDNGLTYGYRISSGMEFELTKRVITGFRLDFSNNQQAEINTLAALKFGVKL